MDDTDDEAAHQQERLVPRVSKTIQDSMNVALRLQDQFFGECVECFEMTILSVVILHDGS